MKTTIKKITALILSLAVVAIAGIVPETVHIPITDEVTITASAEMVGSNVHDILFDYIYYADKYSDLKRAYGYNKTALYNHWITYGKREARSPSSLYDPMYYRSKYADLRNTYGNDYVALYNHFITYGIKEGRQASQYFSVEVYKNNYADLRRAFGTSSSCNLKYLQHWREYGMAEHREGVNTLQSNITPNNNNQSATTYYVKTSGSNLNVRAQASTNASVVGKLANGSSVQVFSISGGWAKISYNGGCAYVSSSYLSKTKPSTNYTYSPINLNFSYNFKQTDSRWSSTKIGTKTIGSIGCTLTCVSMVYSYQNKRNVYPNTMKGKLSFSNNDIIWSSVRNQIGYTPHAYGNCSMSQSIMSTIYSQLKSGKPVIIGCKSKSGSGYHWVVITGYNGNSNTLNASSFTINDPNSNSRVNLQQYLNSYPYVYKLVY